MERGRSLLDEAVDALHQALAANSSAERTRLLGETLRLHRLVLAAVKPAIREGKSLSPAILTLVPSAAPEDQGAL